MRKLVDLFVLLCLSFSAQSANYYISATSGDDTRTATQAQNPASAWKTIERLNAYAGSLQPGDSILFNRGDSFCGTLFIQQSGSLSQPIVYSSYGDANKSPAEITALIRITNWTDMGNGIWVSACPDLGATENMVLFHGAFQVRGRYPNLTAANKGYLNFQSHTGSTAIADNLLTSTPNWTGAEMVMRPNRWVIDRDSIILHSGTDIQYKSATGYTPGDNFGYFIQNSLRTLDLPGEWYYDAIAKKLYMYSGTVSPENSGVQAAAIDNLLYIVDQSNLVFSNLSLNGSNKDAIYISSSAHVSIENCSIHFAGSNAISANSTQGLRIESNTITATSNTALFLNSNCRDGIIRNNHIQNTGMFPGMGQSGNNTYEGILISGNNNVIEFNSIDSTGYIAIDFTGDSILIKNNFVNHFTMSKDDGGGIYTWAGAPNLIPNMDRVITGNIILNGMGAGEGTDDPSNHPSEGIYMDDNTGNVEISDNTIANCGDNGIFLHNAHAISLHQNTLFNNSNQLKMGHDNICPNCYIIHNSVFDNILFSKWIDQSVLGCESTGNDIGAFGAFDRNYYCRPFDDRLSLYNTYMSSGSQVNVLEDLQIWQAAYLKDSSTRKSPLSFSPYTINNFVGSNMYANGSFTSDVNGLYAYSGQGNILADWDNSGILDGGSLRVSFSSNTGLANISKVIIATGAVTAGKRYVVKFSLLGSKDNKTLKSFLRQSQSPYNVLGHADYCKISRSRSEVQFLFTPTVSEANASLIFEIGEQDSTLWFDNLQMYEATVAMSNPDDNIRFEYNASASPRIVSIAGSYMDVKKQSYSGSFTLAPYASVILMKSATVTNNPLHMKNPNEKLNAFPNPAIDVLTIELPENVKTDALLQVLDLTGRVVLSKPIAANPDIHTYQLETQDLLPATYLLKISDAQGVSQTLFVKTMF